MFDNRLFKEWCLYVNSEISVKFIDCFDISFSCIFFDEVQTYYDLIWTHSDGCDYEVAYGIIKETFEPFEFRLFPVLGSEVYDYD